MKLLVLDGNSIVNRAFYGVKLLSTKDGRFTNAIYGFMNILNSLIDREAPDGVAVAFDLHAPTFRHKMYDGYKQGRKPMPEELKEQIPVLKELLVAFGYHCVEKEGYEADDILGTLSAAAEQSGDCCVISTGDRDSLQLVSEKTTVLLATTKMGRPEIIECTPAYLSERYGLTANEMIELKSLMGDASDRIPGVAGVGEKTATDLIKNYHNIDYIYENIDSLDIRDSLRAKLINDRENAFLSRKLGTICRNAPVSTVLKDYTNCPPNEQKLAKMLTELEFFKMLEKLGLQSVSHTAKQSENTPQISFKQADFSAVSAAAEKHKKCAVFTDPKGSAFGVAANGLVAKAPTLQSVLNLAKNGVAFTVADSKAFFHTVGNADDFNIYFDIILAGYLASVSSASYDVELLAKQYLGALPQVENGDEFDQKTAAVAQLTVTLEQELARTEMAELLTKIELPLARTLYEMETVGFMIDTVGIAEMSKELKTRIAESEQKIIEYAGHPFNVKSPSQLGVVLFEELGLPAQKKTKTGYSTTAEILEKLRHSHPIIGEILEYRRLTKLDSTYCEGLLKAVQSDHKIHTTFNQTETRTGRISSLEPNLQNIPVRSEEGARLRRFFTAGEGNVLIDADYSQIELRVLAHIADDKNMQDAFTGGVDIHTKTASEVFDMPPILVTPQMRRSAKAVNFGIVYGMGAFSLAGDIGVSRAEAARYIDGYFNTYPNVKKYMDEVVASAKENGYATTLFHRRRYLPELKSSNHNLRAFGERVAKNMPIQGTAADIIKLAMIQVRDRLKKEKLNARLILQVHDELIVEASSEDAEKAGIILKEEMENAVQLKVPMTVDMHSGKTWYDAKG